MSCIGPEDFLKLPDSRVMFQKMDSVSCGLDRQKKEVLLLLESAQIPYGLGILLSEKEVSQTILQLQYALQALRLLPEPTSSTFSISFQSMPDPKEHPEEQA